MGQTVTIVKMVIRWWNSHSKRKPWHVRMYWAYKKQEKYFKIWILK